LISVLKKAVTWWEGQATTLRIHLQYWMIRGPHLEKRIEELTTANTQLENSNAQLMLANIRLTHDKAVTEAVGCRLLSKYVKDIGGDGSEDERRVSTLVEVGHEWKEMGLSSRDVAAVEGWCKGSDGSSLVQPLTDAVAASRLAAGRTLALTGQVGVQSKARRGKLKSTGLEDEEPKSGGRAKRATPTAGWKRKLHDAWDHLGWVDDEGVFHEVGEEDKDGKDGKGEKESGK
jgi:hypothetical protein